ncbi:hypothetical protein [Streptomyces sp. NPDC005538]|uniref:hypothetical protein n=1 Tax=unclassified Streptomyces TaxID=2593676 RepID=UPI0033AFE0A1
MRADKASGSRANRDYLSKRGIRCTIPEKSDQMAVATRHDKLAVRYEAAVTIAVINEWQ